MDDLSLPYSINRESIESEDYEISGESRPSIEIIRSSNRQSNSSSPSVHSFRISYQKRALFRKSVSLQMRQIGTNILQVAIYIYIYIYIIDDDPGYWFGAGCGDQVFS